LLVAILDDEAVEVAWADERLHRRAIQLMFARLYKN
jgi:hypothetical protein